MSLTDIELRVLRLLLTKGPIVGTAQVGLALWPEQQLTPQGAALAIGGVLRRLVEKRLVKTSICDRVTTYACTTLGDHAQELARLDGIDPRQLSLLDTDSF